MAVRDEILQAALFCFSSEGYEHTTVARIREASGVSNGALFHHFRSKEAIAGALYLDAMASIHDAYRQVLTGRPATIAEGVGDFVRQHLRWIEEHPDLARFIYAQGRFHRLPEVDARLEEMNADIGAAYVEWLEPFIARGDVLRLPLDVMVAIVTGPAHAIAQRWLADGGQGSLLRHADVLAQAATAGLGATPVPVPPSPHRPATARIRIELLDDDGAPLASGRTELRLDPSE
ncbi:AcrR family transcriptional regulator [Kibdelosporangium banguiense]|uniref:AcrR family transcriptional regulator n=1 Tax=Kibdelosporangium banguiense TaxID=1365924 RepID=A0ABS4TTM6_9PSEU|nr:TetR/AcrR family transcriptional regulator [Kibdelosporangium banguiense]MBP2327756.1 AcrR family transcriptional regulator [Kibdelosporangium banguiense]